MRSSRVGRVGLAGLVALAMTLVFGSVVWWATNPVRLSPEVSGLVSTLGQRGDSLRERLGSSSDGSGGAPLAELRQFVEARRDSVRVRVIVGALEAFVVGTVPVWGALEWPERRRTVGPADGSGRAELAAT
jgi:hypothetical protein